MPNYYEQFIKLCNEDIGNMSFSNYYSCVCKCLVMSFNCFPRTAVYEAENSLDTIKEFYDSKKTIYECSVEVGIDHLCG